MSRRSVLSRPKTRGKEQIIAVNIDRVLVVASWRKPAIWPELIDRYLIAAERNHLEAVICVNKIDLVEDQTELEETIQPYREAGYEVLLTSAETGAGIQALRELLAGSVTVLTGLSGVGKSSLLSQVQPGLSLRALDVGERGKNRNQGRHTTTMATLYPLADDGAVIDTPGIREFGLADLHRAELAGFYPEMAALMGGCSYGDCTHTHEPGCRIKSAVAEGEIAELRYENYVKILEGLEG
jgi:ribosome biogenesis GTPase